MGLLNFLFRFVDHFATIAASILAFDVIYQILLHVFLSTDTLHLNIIEIITKFQFDSTKYKIAYKMSKMAYNFIHFFLFS